DNPRRASPSQRQPPIGSSQCSQTRGKRVRHERKPSERFSGACLRITVAVGTTITDRPPHRSVHARLRIRLLPRMNGVEALVGIRMQNTWVRNQTVEQWVETVPSHLRALAAT